AQVEPDGEDVLGLAPDPHEPPPLARGLVALDGLHDRVLGALALEPALDPGRDLVELLLGRRTLDHGRTLPARPPAGATPAGGSALAGRRRAGGEVGVDAPQAGRGGRPRVVA